ASGTNNVYNTSSMGFGNCTAPSGGWTEYDFQDAANGTVGPLLGNASNNATCYPIMGAGQSTGFSTNGQVRAVGSTEFVNYASNYRLASTSVHMKGSGLPAEAGITGDILGNTRNSTYDDIGAIAAPTWEPGLAGGTTYVITA